MFAELVINYIAKIKVSMLLLISFDGWKVGMVLGSLTADITLFI